MGEDMGEDFIVRRMRRDEVELAIDWAAYEGWNPGINDAECFYSADPAGLFVGLLDDEPVGCISAVSYGSAFGFLGLYIVREERRGRGFGMSLWRQAMNHLGERNVGLDGVVGEQENYKKSGFRLLHRSIRFQGTGTGDGRSYPGIVEIAEVPFQDLLNYDTRHFPAERGQFLKSWIAQENSAGFAFIGDGRIEGYGLLRRCQTGFKIGPLFAEDGRVAESLFSALAGRAERGAPVYLDVPEPNSSALSLAARHGMAEIFETARMYTRGDPGLPLGKIFGLTTFELG
ncbi:GNAT family N-acetyltransferase [Methanotrichaceae archaeon M04Ac]|uniref:GNAT family N-acetyltransferase n=1 Tax=Candidatus Methanocrinis alkalitolerans TaxID=3033395 RepID=A0ABT5XDL5_9EURY|nr:GNAT family N-acetyltransferase [Candidatus Methanocrinis alkalitolerans]MDF0592788.1 GNAT family N-acetyltransferase [Candidatus Methanocrinis alkalitolerans]